MEPGNIVGEVVLGVDGCVVQFEVVRIQWFDRARRACRKRVPGGQMIWLSIPDGTKAISPLCVPMYVLSAAICCKPNNEGHELFSPGMTGAS